MHALIFGFRWIRYKFPCAGTSSANRALRLPLEFPTFHSFFDGFFELLTIRISKVDATQLSRIVELRCLDSPVLLFISLTLDMLDQISDHSWSGLVVA